MSGVIVATTVAGVAASVYSANKQAGAQKKAAAQAEANAARAASQADQEMNRANQRKPDVGGILNDARSGGGGGTMLTGPGGVGDDQLKLGRSTLLGG